ncbi:MAG: tRNA-2-methylthio-N(6)-dimethylallyladenosine synthase [Chlamydiae bacterium]|nr:tRNA-2-methylthio-N(6)-dimethylallyladenosine synthase [Chlamydiota bacterium]
MKEPKTYFIRTYGCQMNELDTEVMRGQLEKRGLKWLENEAEVDLLIFNTCSIRDLAERKVMGKLGLLAKKKNSDQIVGVTGCMANAKKESLFKKMPHVHFVLGTNDLHTLNDTLDTLLATGSKGIGIQKHFTEELDYIGAKRDDKLKAYISIIRGCNKYCTYCIVPYTRGPEVSRAPEDIIQECKILASKGYKEITLLGQNVNSYGKDNASFNCLFHDLLYKLDAIDGIERIRFMTSHPVDITRQLMEAIRDLPSLCEFIHFPVQSGSSRILKKMHRIYTLEQYLEKVALLKEIVPNAALGTDIIVGFPTETHEDFMETYKVLEHIEYSVAFLFAYSERKGTPATRFKDTIPEEVKQERLQMLIQLQDGIYKKQRQALIGSTQEVLVERASTRNPHLLKGRTRCWKNAIFPGDASLIGSLASIYVDDFTHQTLVGRKVEEPLSLIS